MDAFDRKAKAPAVCARGKGIPVRSREYSMLYIACASGAKRHAADFIEKDSRKLQEKGRISCAAAAENTVYIKKVLENNTKDRVRHETAPGVR